ncbi:CRISPR-associated ring nuclease Csm6 [Thiorhodococcus minor]|uniref:TIGR02584 family CRISPR-associated protein n=1 Tax=Thiorhodococcus minor TaxID=57489 RepID=A0A6M0K4K7_9GAMM|nr:CRISPR-associated ring nuclease Csm6 [Thiorhodococcus minor]NEV63527.1 TIGR02584 family CRISPR-associated protein [Thiorhodococcus minor]
MTASTLSQPPYAYPRRILLAVSGLSPQILTETLYALAVQQQPAFIPTEIHLITTSEGAKRARLSLLSEEPGWLARLCRDYGLPALTFGEEQIQVPHDAEGEAMADIRTLADNMRMADLITERVRALTADPASALHVSIAGGRKTMGYYVGYALSLFGRVQDRLSHVLVDEAFESSWDFFYPTPYSRVVATRDNKLIDTQEGQVILADIPFVRLRDGIPERLQKGQATFAETIDAAQRAQLPPELVIDLERRRIRVAGEPVRLDPRELAFYSLMARRRLKDMHPARWTTEGLAQQYLAEYRLILGEYHGDYARAEELLAEEMSKDTFEQYKSRTNRALEAALGATLAKPYRIQPSGKRPETKFGLKLEAEAIRYGEVAEATDDS